jgi:hypothetical protein
VRGVVGGVVGGTVTRVVVVFGTTVVVVTGTSAVVVVDMTAFTGVVEGFFVEEEPLVAPTTITRTATAAVIPAFRPVFQGFRQRRNSPNGIQNSKETINTHVWSYHRGTAS